jgi:hypothetical protein
VTISRIGTFYTTITPTGKSTAIGIPVPAETPVTGAEATTVPIAKKTTYAPVSPLTVLGALAVAAGTVAMMRRK